METRGQKEDENYDANCLLKRCIETTIYRVNAFSTVHTNARNFMLDRPDSIETINLIRTIIIRGIRRNTVLL